MASFKARFFVEGCCRFELKWTIPPDEGWVHQLVAPLLAIYLGDQMECSCYPLVVDIIYALSGLRRAISTFIIRYFIGF
jgi:hypothetical protein